MRMDCTDCEALLDDLLGDELPARCEAEVRSHLAGCPGCRAKHMQRLRVVELTAAPKQLPALKRLSWPSRLWRWLRPTRTSPQTSASLGLLGRLATAPQVAMSTVMLLIVLVGLWALPQLTRRRTPRFDDGAVPLAARSPATDVSATANPDASPTRALTNASRDETSTNAARSGQVPSTAADTKPAPSGSANAQRHKLDLAAGLAHYRAREYALATPLFSRALVSASSSSEEAMTLLYLARAERALGHCDRAVNSYTTLVRVHAAKAEALAALREGVACYDQLAEPAVAQHLLEQAAATPELSVGARSLLSQRTTAAPRKSAK
jgi:hypothetical protein